MSITEIKSSECLICSLSYQSFSSAQSTSSNQIHMPLKYSKHHSRRHPRLWNRNPLLMNQMFRIKEEAEEDGYDDDDEEGQREERDKIQSNQPNDVEEDFYEGSQSDSFDQQQNHEIDVEQFELRDSLDQSQSYTVKQENKSVSEHSVSRTQSHQASHSQFDTQNESHLHPIAQPIQTFDPYTRLTTLMPYHVHLHHALTQPKWGPKEDYRLHNLLKKYGTNWNIIMRYFPHFRVVNVKHQFYTRMYRSQDSRWKWVPGRFQKEIKDRGNPVERELSVKTQTHRESKKHQINQKKKIKAKLKRQQTNQNYVISDVKSHQEMYNKLEIQQKIQGQQENLNENAYDLEDSESSQSIQNFHQDNNSKAQQNPRNPIASSQWSDLPLIFYVIPFQFNPQFTILLKLFPISQESKPFKEVQMIGTLRKVVEKWQKCEEKYQKQNFDNKKSITNDKTQHKSISNKQQSKHPLICPVTLSNNSPMPIAAIIGYTLDIDLAALEELFRTRMSLIYEGFERQEKDGRKKQKINSANNQMPNCNQSKVNQSAQQLSQQRQTPLDGQFQSYHPNSANSSREKQNKSKPLWLCFQQLQLLVLLITSRFDWALVASTVRREVQDLKDKFGEIVSKYRGLFVREGMKEENHKLKNNAMSQRNAASSESKLSQRENIITKLLDQFSNDSLLTSHDSPFKHCKVLEPYQQKGLLQKYRKPLKVCLEKYKPNHKYCLSIEKPIQQLSKDSPYSAIALPIKLERKDVYSSVLAKLAKKFEDNGELQNK